MTEKDFVSGLYKRKAFMPIAMHHIIRMEFLCIFACYAELIDCYKHVKEFEKYILGTVTNLDSYFYYVIGICALYNSFSRDSQAMYRREISNVRDKFKTWANQSPNNFSPRYFLVEAEIARIDGNFLSAMSFYDRAIDSARENEFAHIEAIACERAAVFWHELGKNDFAALYLKRAYTCYFEWGASRKLESLRLNYPEIFGEYPEELDGLNSADVLSMLKAFNLISGHDNIADLLKDITRIVLEFSGAGFFALILERNGKLELQASGSEGFSDIQVMQSVPIDGGGMDLPVEMIRYIHRTEDNIITYNGYSDDVFSGITYLNKTKHVSAMCLKAETEAGSVIWYLENIKKIEFEKPVRSILEILAKQAGICIQNVMYRQRNRKSIDAGFTVKTSGEFRTIPYNSIVYFSSFGRSSVVHTTGKDYEISSLLRNIGSSVPENLFLRIHKQYIVNVKYVSRMIRDRSGRYCVYLNDDDDTCLFAGRKYLDALKEKLKTRIPAQTE